MSMREKVHMVEVYQTSWFYVKTQKLNFQYYWNTTNNLGMVPTSICIDTSTGIDVSPSYEQCYQ